MRKILHIKHHFDDYECMWNGIEDVFMEKTGQELPPNFFFALSSFASFCYMKTDKSDLKRLVALGDGRTEKMYEFLAPIIGLKYKHISYGAFERALSASIVEINKANPVVLGALDMNYLPYFRKLYHQGESIPFHYVLMTGYDDEKEEVYVYDCGRTEIAAIPYLDLKDAWNCSYPGLSKPFTLCKFDFENINDDIYRICKEALSRRADVYLNPPVGFIGYKGFEKFIIELKTKWNDELSKEDFNTIIRNLIFFFGTVPGFPNRLKGSNEKDATPFCGGFGKTALILDILGKKYKDRSFLAASKIFYDTGFVIEEITNNLVDYLLDINKNLDKTTDLLIAVKDNLYQGLKILKS